MIKARAELSTRAFLWFWKVNSSRPLKSIIKPQATVLLHTLIVKVVVLFIRSDFPLYEQKEINLVTPFTLMRSMPLIGSLRRAPLFAKVPVELLSRHSWRADRN